jgi:hypothetical protein
MLSLQETHSLISIMLALQMMIQGFEHFRLDLKQHAFQTKSGLAENLVLIFIASLTFWTPNFWVWLGLFFYRLRHLLRFNGLFAGGSEVLIQYSFLAVISYYLPQGELLCRALLLLLGALVLLSYFSAGLNKLRSYSWRNGTAVVPFLKFRVVYNFYFLENLRPQTYKILSWIIIIFELMSFGVLIWPHMAAAYLGVAAVFHFGNFLVFGLNRFFWSWISAYPAAIYLAGQIPN